VAKATSRSCRLSRKLPCDWSGLDAFRVRSAHTATSAWGTLEVFRLALAMLGKMGRV
jgi:hypothetical protein